MGGCAALAAGFRVLRHALDRGPVPFRRAVANYLEQERAQVARDVEVLGEYTPFRKGEPPEIE